MYEDKDTHCILLIGADIAFNRLNCKVDLHNTSVVTLYKYLLYLVNCIYLSLFKNVNQKTWAIIIDPLHVIFFFYTCVISSTRSADLLNSTHMPWTGG